MDNDRSVSRRPAGREPVPEGLPAELSPQERREARMRLVAGRRLVGVTIVLDGIHDPHNISAVLRSCDAFGVQHAHIIGSPSALPINRAITQGCEKWLTLHYHRDAEACAASLAADGFALWAAAPDRRARPLDSLDFSQKLALAFGAERSGLSDQLLKHCAGVYFIPMSGFSQSLNVSVAAAISLYVATRRRRAAVGAATDLDPEEVEALAREWILADRARKAGDAN